VKKSFEITGFGAVVLIDTAGIDDSGELGMKRIEKSYETIKQIDLAILVIAHNIFTEPELKLIAEFENYSVPYIIIYNKTDLEMAEAQFVSFVSSFTKKEIISCSTLLDTDFENIIKAIKKAVPESAFKVPTMIGDLISYGDIVLLITPIDNEAPAGRLILPQVQAIRDILDNDAVAIILKEKEVDAFLKKTAIKPALVITDSSIFLKADASIPKDVPLTGFSIVLARLRGDFDAYLKGTPVISQLKDGDRVLILESCTHHVSCDDIGRVKIPRWITNFTGKNIQFDVVSGLEKPEREMKEYALVIQCGGCVITRKQLLARLKPAIDAGVPVTNYGMAIAYVQGIYNRAIAPFTGQNSEQENYL